MACDLRSKASRRLIRYIRWARAHTVFYLTVLYLILWQDQFNPRSTVPKNTKEYEIWNMPCRKLYRCRILPIPPPYLFRLFFLPDLKDKWHDWNEDTAARNVGGGKHRLTSATIKREVNSKQPVWSRFILFLHTQKAARWKWGPRLVLLLLLPLSPWRNRC